MDNVVAICLRSESASEYFVSNSGNFEGHRATHAVRSRVIQHVSDCEAALEPAVADMAQDARQGSRLDQGKYVTTA